MCLVTAPANFIYDTSCTYPFIPTHSCLLLERTSVDTERFLKVLVSMPIEDYRDASRAVEHAFFRPKGEPKTTDFKSPWLRGAHPTQAPLAAY